jgi:NodT family efflux transporter outer membrane factor (OMF) lipoprotein
MTRRTLSVVLKHDLRVLAFPVLLSGCMVGPEYDAPSPAEMPFVWAGVDGDPNVTTTEQDLTDWWTRFGDEQMTRVVKRAVVASPDVQEAVARLLENRFLRAAENGARVPSIDLSAGYTRSRISENLDGFAAVTGGDSSEGFAFQPETDLWEVTGGFSWELDLFGRIARRVQEADRLVEASFYDLQAIRVALAADVAEVYVEIRELQNRLRIAEENVQIQERSLRLAEARFEGGLTTQLDVSQALSNVLQTRATVPALRAQLQVARNRLALLAGEEPAYTDEVVTGDLPVPTTDGEIAIGLPADLVRRRPDIRRAERELAAAFSRVGASEADLLPRFSLAGNFGFAAGDADNVFDWDSRTFGIGPAVNWPIFQGGTLRALVGVADARVGIARAEYRRVVLEALSEVADALTNLAQDRARREILFSSVTAARRAVELAEAQYTDGLVDFDRVIDTQTLLFQTEDALAIAESAVTRDTIALYRSLGGGWRVNPLPADD